MIRAALILGSIVIASAIMFKLLGFELYSAIAGVLFVLVLVLVYIQHGLARNDESAPLLVWIGGTIGLAITCALFWFAIPLMWSVIDGRRRGVASGDDRRGA